MTDTELDMEIADVARVAGVSIITLGKNMLDRQTMNRLVGVHR